MQTADLKRYRLKLSSARLHAGRDVTADGDGGQTERQLRVQLRKLEPAGTNRLIFIGRMHLIYRHILFLDGFSFVAVNVCDTLTVG